MFLTENLSRGRVQKAAQKSIGFRNRFEVIVASYDRSRNGSVCCVGFKEDVLRSPAEDIWPIIHVRLKKFCRCIGAFGWSLVVF